MDASAFLPEGVPAHWSIYFGVEDADASLGRIVELGGSIVEPAEDTPYGRLARVPPTRPERSSSSSSRLPSGLILSPRRALTVIPPP